MGFRLFDRMQRNDYKCFYYHILKEISGLEITVCHLFTSLYCDYIHDSKTDAGFTLRLKLKDGVSLT